MASTHAKQQQQEVRRLTARLVQHLTGLNSGDEGFQEAIKFTASNFQYHRFLAPDAHKIRRTYWGLIEKFEVNTQPDKANAMRFLLPRFLGLPLPTVELPKSDEHFALLSVLSLVARNPTGTPFNPGPIRFWEPQPENTYEWARELLRELHREEEQAWRAEEVEEPIDWHDVEDDVEDLRFALANAVVPDSQLELSHLVAEPEGTRPVAPPRPIAASGPSGAPQRAYPQARAEQDARDIARLHELVDCSSDGLDGPPTLLYRADAAAPADPRLHAFLGRPCGTAALWAQAQLAVARAAPFVECSTPVLEARVVREVLWLLLGAAESALFRIEEGNRCAVRPGVCPLHLTPLAFQTAVHQATQPVEVVNELRGLCAATQAAALAEPDGEGNGRWAAGLGSSTMQALAAALGDYLKAFDAQLVQLEPDTTTLLQLNRALAPEASELRALLQLATAPAGTTPAETSAALLSALYDAAVRMDTSPLPAASRRRFLDLFIATIAPTLRAVEIWISKGLVLDDNHEFAVVVVDPSAPDLWKDRFVLRKAAGDATPARDRGYAFSLKAIPSFLHASLYGLLVGGKSSAVLRELGLLGHAPSALGLEAELRVRLGVVSDDASPAGGPAQMRGAGKLAVALQNLELRSADDEECDLLMQASFRYQAKASKRTRRELVWPPPPRAGAHDGAKAGPGGALSGIESFALRFQVEFGELLTARYRRASGRLLEVLTGKFELMQHFRHLRGCLLMAYGDLMQDICSQIFNKVNRRDLWHNEAELNAILHSSLRGFKMEGLSDRLSFSLDRDAARPHGDIDALHGLTCHYEVPFPLTLFFNAETLGQYNQVFGFLLQLKRARWSLLSLRLRDQFLDARLPAHKILLLRAKIMHSVHALTDYVMNRILSSLGRTVDADIAQAPDVDQVQAIHQAYLQALIHRCLLHKKTNMVRAAIVKILSVALTFREYWDAAAHHATLRVAGVQRPIRESDFVRLEDEHSKCLFFLQDLLVSLTKSGSFPHLEALHLDLGSTDAGAQRGFRLWPTRA